MIARDREIMRYAPWKESILQFIGVHVNNILRFSFRAAESLYLRINLICVRNNISRAHMP